MLTTVPIGTSTTVEVPATSANLGPGFDCFGLALDWREQVQLTAIERGFRIEVSGEGADHLPRDESHLVVRSVLIGLADLGVSITGLELRSHNTIPHGRGLGSSSAAIVAGLVGAAALAGVEPEPKWLLRHANAIEGHPDNVAAAIHGGFVLAYEGREGVDVVRSAVDPTIELAIFIPYTSVETKAARGLLPEMVPHVDAAANSGRAALLVHAMARDPDRLYEGTHDWLHQGYRESAMPKSYELMTCLRRQGLAAVISGAGSTVLVLGRAAEIGALTEDLAPGFELRRGGVGEGAMAVEIKRP